MNRCPNHPTILMRILEDDTGKYAWCPVCFERVKFE
jgi:hypothetical protein